MSRNDDGRWDDIINMDFPKLTSRSPKFMSGNVTIGEYEYRGESTFVGLAKESNASA